jgi:hypothetical protein
VKRDRYIGIIAVMFFVVCTTAFLIPLPSVSASTVTLTWDANTEPALAGYRLFSYQKGETFDCTTPVWEGSDTTCTLEVSDSTTWYFVVRAVNTAGYESADSNIVVYDPSTTDPLDADTDDDGILDGWEDANHNGLVDPGETDPCNADTDGDGIQDGTELGYTLGDIGPDTDTAVFQPDLDLSTTTDPLNPDTDGDGISDGEEDTNHNGRVDPGESDPTLRPDLAGPILLLLGDD